MSSSLWLELAIGNLRSPVDLEADVVVLDWSQSDIQHPQVREPGGSRATSYRRWARGPAGARRRSFWGVRGTARRAVEDLRGQRVNVPATLRVRATRPPDFRRPIAIDRDQLIAKPWPKEWTEPHGENHPGPAADPAG